MNYNKFTKNPLELRPAAWVADELLLTFGLVFADAFGKRT